MSCSYECTIVCDLCGMEMIAGESLADPQKAKDSALVEAENNEWQLEGGRCVCPECRTLTIIKNIYEDRN